MIKKLTIVVFIAVVLLSGCTKPVDETPVPSPDSTPKSTAISNDEPAQLKITGQIGGPTQAVAVQGDYAYIGTGMRLEVLDVSDPALGLMVGATEPFGGEVRDIVVDGDFAYVAASGGGLNIVNLSNPVQATVQGGYDTPGYAESVAVVDHYAYLADGPYGLSIMDISNPAKPTEIGTAYQLNYVFDVDVVGHFAYLAAAGAGLLVVDISNPAKPMEVGACDTPGYAYGITISGTTLYIADGWEGLQVFDILNPAQPRIIGSYKTTGWAMDIAAVGAQLYVADTFGGLRIMDITNAGKPTEIGNYTVPDGHAQSIAIAGSLAYVADIHHGVHIIDVSTPSQPQQIVVYNPMGYAHAVAVSGSYAYVASETYGLRVIDIADPAKPREVAGLATDGLTVAVATSGNTAYVGTFFSSSSRHCNLYAVDISDPLYPRASSPISLLGHKGNQTFEGKDSFPEQDTSDIVPRSVFIQGTTIYIAGEWGLLSLDISDPLNPHEVSFLQTSRDPSLQNPPVNTGTATGVAVVENMAYLAVQGGGLQIISLADPKRPVLLGVFNEPAVVDPTGKKNPKGVYINDVIVSLPFAYILDQDILRVIDVSDHAHPKSIGTYPLPVIPFNSGGGAARSLTINGNRLFIADNSAGLLMFDITDPAKPQLVEQLRLSGLAQWVTTNDQYIFVANGQGGLYIIELNQDSSRIEVPSPQQSSTSTAHDTSFYLSTLSAYEEDISQMSYVSSVVNQYELSSFIAAPSRSDAFATQTVYIPVTYTVSSLEDSGSESLRECLEKANSGDTITFDPQVFPPETPATIYATSGLSLSKGGITVDGSNTGVIIDGSKVLKWPSGFKITSNGNTIKGLQILNFPYSGIALGGCNNTIGGDRTRGMGPLGEGNLITGNGLFEIETKEASGNLIIGNYIGTDITGRNKLGNPKTGWSVAIWSSSSCNRIESNIIAGSLVFCDSGSSYNEVVGNHIGCDVSGTIAFEGDIHISVGQPFNRIGGTQPGEGNVINGTVMINRTSDILVMGNLIGTTAHGNEAFDTTGWLINLEEGSHHNFIGGTTEAERNVINGGSDSTLVHLGGCTKYNFIAGNYLGLDATGSVTIPNVSGISLEAAEHNFIQMNFVSGSQTAISLSSFDWDKPGANFNYIRANRVTQSNKLGIAVGSGESNLIIWNSLLNNNSNGYDGGSKNSWDDGKEGNYWDDYTGQDEDDNGIGDIPYPVAPNGVDNYPLMKPYGQ